MKINEFDQIIDKFDQIRYPVTWRYRTVKKMNKTIWTALLLAFALILSASSVQAVTIGDLFGWLAGDEDSSGSSDDREKDSGKRQDAEDTSDDDYYMSLDVSEDGEYDTKDEVCAYLVQYHELPSNYMTKKEARKKGWEGGALNRLIDGMCIGGDYYGNYEGVLPEIRGREYHECDIDTLKGSSRGPKRIVYSGDDDNGDWNIYYTDDHYETFTLLWGDDDY